MVNYLSVFRPYRTFRAEKRGMKKIKGATKKWLKIKGDQTPSRTVGDHIPYISLISFSHLNLHLCLYIRLIENSPIFPMISGTKLLLLIYSIVIYSYGIRTVLLFYYFFLIWSVSVIALVVSCLWYIFRRSRINKVILFFKGHAFWFYQKIKIFTFTENKNPKTRCNNC